EWLGRNGGAADRNQYSDTHNNCTRSKCFHGKTLLNSSHRPTCAFGEGRLEQRPDIQDSVKGCRAAPGKENSAGAMPLGDRDRHREKCGKGSSSRARDRIDHASRPCVIRAVSFASAPRPLILRNSPSKQT